MQRNKGILTLTFVSALVSAMGWHGITSTACPAESAPSDEEAFENVLGMEFVLIPTGEFLMGTPASDVRALQRAFPSRRPDNISDESPQHRVRITKPFMLGTREVTVEHFDTFVNATGYRTDAERTGKGGSGWNRNSRSFDSHRVYNWRNTGFEQGVDHPVVNVSWNDAQEFCRWLGRLEKRDYRLPTEAEWEYACRAGSTAWFSCGNTAEELTTIANVSDRSARVFWGTAARSWTFLRSDDGYAFTGPVGKLKANAWGLYDMHGNAWEWCEDRYDASYYRTSPVADPTGPARGGERVCRGGSWGTFAQRCRAAYRNHGDADESARFIGFRVALEPAAP